VGDTVIAFTDVTKQAYLARVQLSASGFYATPDIAYDRAAHKGRPSTTSPMARRSARW
jgi:xanthine dehydrogenase large subunit